MNVPSPISSEEHEIGLGLVLALVPQRGYGELYRKGHFPIYWHAGRVVEWVPLAPRCNRCAMKPTTIQAIDEGPFVESGSDNVNAKKGNARNGISILLSIM